jgi:hypothetical protein
MPDPQVVRWESLVGRTFALECAEHQAHPLVLTACRPAGSSFTLDFRAGPDAPPEQAIYLLTAPDNPEPMPVFLVPSAATADAVTYHAVFTSLPEHLSQRAVAPSTES